MDQNDDLGTLLHFASSSLDQHSDYVLREKLGIGLSQFRILLVLLSEDGQNQISIADNLDQTEASISRQIKILKGKKLVEVRPKPNSKREKIVFITGKGLMLGESGLSILNSYHLPLFTGINEHDQKALKNILRSIHSHVEQLYDYEN